MLNTHDHEKEINGLPIEIEPKKVMFVASKSQIKLDAVGASLDNYKVLGIDSQSNIPEQPMGIDQILMGARNRILTARANGATGSVTAIENGLVLGSELIKKEMREDAVGGVIEDSVWYDVALVIVEDEEGRQVESFSRGVKVPQYLIEKVLAVGDQSITMGKFLKEEHPEVNHQDPHIFLTNGKIGRVALMKEAISDAYRKLQVS